jgi:hypothetical protein
MVVFQLTDGNLRYVTAGKAHLPRTGNWVADVRVVGEEALPATLVLQLGEVEMPCAVSMDELVNGARDVRVVGGAGGIGETCRPRHYHRPLLRHVLADLLRDCGERLSPQSDQAVLGLPLEGWDTLAVPNGAMLGALCSLAGEGINWRVLFDGSVWVGAETWPASPADARSIEMNGVHAASVVGTDVPSIWPGTTLAGRQIDHVVHDFDTDRSTIFYAELA